MQIISTWRETDSESPFEFKQNVQFLVVLVHPAILSVILIKFSSNLYDILIPIQFIYFLQYGL